jgi:hypothetical protein
MHAFVIAVLKEDVVYRSNLIIILIQITARTLNLALENCCRTILCLQPSSYSASLDLLCFETFRVRITNDPLFIRNL